VRLYCPRNMNPSFLVNATENVGAHGIFVSPPSSFRQNNPDSDASQWLYPDKVVNSTSDCKSQDATLSSPLQDVFVNPMEDMPNDLTSKSADCNNSSTLPSSRHQHVSSQLQQSASRSSLHMQSQHATGDDIASDYSNTFHHSPQQQFNSTSMNYVRLPSYSHNSFSEANLGFTTSNLWQRRLKQFFLENEDSTAKDKDIRRQAPCDQAQHSDATKIAPPQNGLYNYESATIAGSNVSNQSNVTAPSINSVMSSTGQSSWNLNTTTLSPQGLDPSMLPQSPYWIQRDRAHFCHSNQDVTSPHKSASDEISSQPILSFKSLGLLQGSLPSTEYNVSPRIRMERQYEDDAVNSGQNDRIAHNAKHRRMGKKGGSQRHVNQKESSYATISRNSAAATAASSSAMNKTISKIVVDKLGTIDGGALSAELGGGIETRHLCPHPGCDKHFSTSGHARRHSRNHAGVRPFACPHLGCEAAFTRRDNRSQHQKSRHRSQLPIR
jgi:hypothetical protein